ncbi:MAG: AI-2E family transporter [Alcanivoracaceae bacterium]
MPHDTPESLLGGANRASHTPSASTSARRLFTALELRLFRYTAILASLVAFFALIAVTVWSLGWVLSAFYNLLLPLALAGILALVLYPVVGFLETRLRLPRLLAIILLLTVFFACIGGLMFLLVPTVISQGIQLMTILPETLASWQEDFSARFPDLSDIIFSRFTEGDSSEELKQGLPALKTPRTTIMSYIGLLAGISFVPLFLFFALLSGESLRGQASELLSIFNRSTQQKVLYFVDVFVGYVTAFFQGQLIIALCMGGLYAVSFMLIGLKFGALAGLVLGLLNIVPFLGSLIGLLVILPMAYLQPDGGVELLILAGLVFAAVQAIESWLLTPKIMSNHSGLHPAVVVISLFFWGTALSGIIGMVLAVPLTAFFFAIWREIKASLEHALSSEDTRS